MEEAVQGDPVPAVVAREILARAKERLKAVGVGLHTRRRGEPLGRFLDWVEDLVERSAKKI